MTLRAGVIGVGNMGKNHARVYHELDACELVAVADLDVGRVAPIVSSYNCDGYKNYKQMLNEQELDIVSIVVPTSYHKDVALEVASRGIHFLLEKPISDTLENADDIIKAVDKAGVKCLVGHIERFNPGVAKLKELVDSGRFGEISTLIAKRVGAIPFQVIDANIVVDVAVHDIDICNYLLDGAPLKVYAQGNRAVRPDTEDNVIIALAYGKSDAVIIANWITPVKIRELAITGTKGYAELNYGDQELKLFEHDFHGVYDDYGEFIKMSRPREIDVEIEKGEPLKLEIAHIVECVENDQEPRMCCRDAKTALEVALEANKMLGKS